MVLLPIFLMENHQSAYALCLSILRQLMQIGQVVVDVQGGHETWRNVFDDENEAAAPEESDEENFQKAWASEMKVYSGKITKELNMDDLSANQLINPLKWWAELDSGRCPMLCSVAKLLLQTTSQAAASERVFSCMGTVVTKHRCNLNGTFAGDLIVSAIRYKQASRQLKDEKGFVMKKFPPFGISADVPLVDNEYDDDHEFSDDDDDDFDEEDDDDDELAQEAADLLADNENYEGIQQYNGYQQWDQKDDRVVAGGG